MTALHFASSMGHVDVVRLLLNRGANLALEDEGGQRAYHYAQEGGHTDVEKMLTQAEIWCLDNASTAG